ncbi:MAG: hypothetical protein RMJ37_05715 [Spirochaetia bacterium]|nr:hypothetical protein [Spirochaetota bacterium]MCX8097336.1 hypothetical protein [Spirochaetota bacterium]MDW8112815.1 hypothetical protein [Spirochaetia bacterium]
MSLRTILRTSLDKITHNLPLKLLSLVLAFIVWFYLKNITTDSYEFYIPINYRGLPPDATIVNHNNIPNYVLVKITGSKEKLSKILELPRHSIYAYVDLSVQRPNSIYEVKLVLPDEMKNLELYTSPKEILVDIDKLVETNLSVEVANSPYYYVFPNEVKIRTISRNIPKLTTIRVSIDTNSTSGTVVLENTEFLSYYPNVLFFSNVSKRGN